jgi:hypothetical protein
MIFLSKVCVNGNITGRSGAIPEEDLATLAFEPLKDAKTTKREWK